MRNVVRQIMVGLSPIIDILFALAVIPAAWVMLGFRRFGARRLPVCRQLLRRIGVFPIRNHYYEPFFTASHTNNESAKERTVPGVRLDEQCQLEVLRGMAHADELRALRLEVPGQRNHGFRMNNGTFGYGDADFLYQFLRTIRPRRVVEIGGGASTIIAKLALARNEIESGESCIHRCIEPYENPWLEQLGVDIIRKRVEQCPLDLFHELSAGDLLFVDTSHVIRPGGDVLFIYLNILPILRAGVYVHIHDIFTPHDYPRRWTDEDVLFWNEQYLVEMMLSMSDRMRIVAALNYLWREHFEALQHCCPYLSQDVEPGSLYLQVR